MKYFSTERKKTLTNLASEIFPVPILLLASPTVPAEPATSQKIRIYDNSCSRLGSNTESSEISHNRYTWPDPKPTSQSSWFLLRTDHTPPHQPSTRLVDPARREGCQENWTKITPTLWGLLWPWRLLWYISDGESNPTTSENRIYLWDKRKIFNGKIKLTMSGIEQKFFEDLKPPALYLWKHLLRFGLAQASDTQRQ